MVFGKQALELRKLKITSIEELGMHQLAIFVVKALET
jgi:hypothetical protein